MTLNEYIKSSDLEVSVSGDMLGTFISNNDDDRYENITQKVNSRWFEFYRAYSILFTLSNVGKCFWSWILKDHVKVQEKKKKVVDFGSRPLQNANLGTFTFNSRATTTKKCTKKAWCTWKVFFFLANLSLLRFWRFRCRHRRLCLSSLVTFRRRRGALNKVLYGKLRPQVQPLTFLVNTIFWQESYLFRRSSKCHVAY